MRTRIYVRICLLSSVATLMMVYLQIPYAGVIPMRYDPSDVASLIGAFAMGPVAGVIIVVLKDFLFFLFKPNIIEVIGVPMNFLASGSFAFTAGFIYFRKKTKTMAIVSLAVGIVVMTLVMVVANYFFILYLWDYFLPPFNQKEKLISILVGTVIPFNFLKGIINSAIVFLLYKRVRNLFKDEAESIASLRVELL